MLHIARPDLGPIEHAERPQVLTCEPISSISRALLPLAFEREASPPASASDYSDSEAEEEPAAADGVRVSSAAAAAAAAAAAGTEAHLAHASAAIPDVSSVRGSDAEGVCGSSLTALLQQIVDSRDQQSAPASSTVVRKLSRSRSVIGANIAVCRLARAARKSTPIARTIQPASVHPNALILHIKFCTCVINAHLAARSQPALACVCCTWQPAAAIVTHPLQQAAQMEEARMSSGSQATTSAAPSLSPDASPWSWCSLVADPLLLTQQLWATAITAARPSATTRLQLLRVSAAILGPRLEQQWRVCVTMHCQP